MKNSENNIVKTVVVFSAFLAGLPLCHWLFPNFAAFLHIGLLSIGAWKVSACLTTGK